MLDQTFTLSTVMGSDSATFNFASFLSGGQHSLKEHIFSLNSRCFSGSVCCPQNRALDKRGCLVIIRDNFC